MKPLKVYVDKFYKVLNVNNDSLIVICVVLEGLLADYMAKGNYIGLAIELLGDYKRLCKNKRLYIQLG